VKYRLLATPLRYGGARTPRWLGWDPARCGADRRNRAHALACHAQCGAQRRTQRDSAGRL